MPKKKKKKKLRAYRVTAWIRVCAESPAKALRVAEEYTQGYRRREGLPEHQQPESEVDRKTKPVLIA